MIESLNIDYERDENGNIINSVDNQLAAEINANSSAADKILDFINGNKFNNLYLKYFKEPTYKCMEFAEKKSCLNDITTICSYSLEQLGTSSYRELLEGAVLNVYISNAKKQMSDTNCSVKEAINYSTSKSVNDKEFLDQISSLMSKYAKVIGQFYVDYGLSQMANNLDDSKEDEGIDERTIS